MFKSLLSLLLAGTQVLSWNALPVYLCLSADGSVCVDFGPAGCGCCHVEETDGCADEGCPDGHGRHDVHQPLASTLLASTVPASTVPDADPCGCTHVQISQPQSAKLEAGTSAPDAHRLASSLATLSHPAAGCCDLATGRAYRPHPPDELFGPLSQRSTVVLRL